MRIFGGACFAAATASLSRDARLAPSFAEPPSAATATAAAATATATASSNPSSPPFARHGLLISSFSDGVLASPPALSYLRLGLARSLAADLARRSEGGVRSSALHSPCNGPDVDALGRLEGADAAAAAAAAAAAEGGTAGDRDQAAGMALRAVLDAEAGAGGAARPRCRVLYVPTAMYALRADSSSSKGKQRQRARADGKKRRNQVVAAVEGLLRGGEGEACPFDVLACTLDLDDSSIKQPAGAEGDAAAFPRDGREALTDWRPHLVYVEGGNTFWLRHCIEKGDWAGLLADSCTGPDAATYVGKSAGAIVAGGTVETACWKGWDDPGVVPGKGTYSDWVGCEGLGLAGEASIFPHMDDVWEELVVEKKGEMGDAGGHVRCLREWEACCINGENGEVFVVGALTD